MSAEVQFRPPPPPAGPGGDVAAGVFAVLLLLVAVIGGWIANDQLNLTGNDIDPAPTQRGGSYIIDLDRTGVVRYAGCLWDGTYIETAEYGETLMVQPDHPDCQEADS